MIYIQFPAHNSIIGAVGNALHQNPSGRGIWRLSLSLRNQWHTGVEPTANKELVTAVCLKRACIRILQLGSPPEWR
jgi:hypothetical protein